MYGNNSDYDLSHFSIGGKDLAPTAAPTAAPSNTNIDKQKLLAKLLASQSASQDNTATQYVNGWAVPQPSTQGIGDIIGTLGAMYMGRK